MIPTNRYIALDVFRGLTICLMIIVNTPGNHDTIYAPLQHAAWHGFTPADLVYPSFLFAVGNALCFAVAKWANMTQGQVLAKIFKRSLLLFLLGFLLYWFPFVQWGESGIVFKSFAETRVLGVLQRIALCYCIAALLVYYLKATGALVTAVFLLIAWQFILFWFGVPGQELTMAGNAGTRLDLWLLGPGHMNHTEAIPFEAEGLLGTLPAVALYSAKRKNHPYADAPYIGGLRPYRVGVGLECWVSHKQEPVDKFIRIAYGWARLPYSCRRYLRN